MGKPTFRRAENGGYNAAYRVGSVDYTAYFVKPDRDWIVAEGFGEGGREWRKLGDLKVDWRAMCDADGEGGAAPTMVGPPSLGGPPPMSGPPKLGPPPIPAVTPSQMPVLRGEKANTPVEMTAFKGFLKEQGKLCGPCKNGFAQCEDCKRHVSDWAEDDDGVIRPPCRCVVPEGLASEYVADSLDPRMWGMTLDGSMRTLSPVGALDQVFNWMRKNLPNCSSNGRLVEPFASVRSVLFGLTGYAEYRPEVWKQ